MAFAFFKVQNERIFAINNIIHFLVLFFDVLNAFIEL